MRGTKDKDFVNSVSGHVVHLGLKLHMSLGPGLLENVYETLLARDLGRMGLRVERQKCISFEYDGLWFEDACRLDLLVEDAVVVEIKSVEKLIPLYEKQLLTYLRVTGYPVGLILNFGAERMKDGLKRLANWPVPPA